MLADLFYTGRDSGIAFYARRNPGRPSTHYEQVYPLPQDLDGPVLAVLRTPPNCPTLAEPMPVGRGTGAYARMRLTAYLVDGACLNGL